MNDPRFRSNIILGMIALVFITFSVRLFYLQVMSDDYAESARNNAIKKVVIQPARGIIYDRWNKIYVQNLPIFNLFVTPKELVIPDTLLLEKYFAMTRDEIRKKLKEAKKFSNVKPSIFAKQLDGKTVSSFQEFSFEFEGLQFESVNKREYVYPVGGNFLGYISEVNDKDIKNSAGYYRMGDVIGTSGIERSYERMLRGKKGVRFVLHDVHNREVGRYADGSYDSISRRGTDLLLGIDAELQELGEKMMKNKMGSIVAIEPGTGEVLSFVSAPTYDPNLLTGREFSPNYRILERDSLKPLYNRPLMAMYPPGSIFKILNALAALNEGTLTSETAYGCGGGFMRNKGKPKCHRHPSPLALPGAITYSCNAYFSAVYMDMLLSHKYQNLYDAYNTWYAYMQRFGVGRTLGIDLPNEKPGLLPTPGFYDKWYGHDHWNPLTIISNAIGQGEILMTPLQMANVVAMIANKGYYIVPHFTRAYRDSTGNWQHVTFDTIYSGVDPIHFPVVIDAMEQVVISGTGTLARIDSISVCGKTGTAQNPHGKDHSVFFAFAPKENPKIAVAVIVENAGWGGSWAAPIASLMMEYYLTRKIKDPTRLDRILDAAFLPQKYIQKRDSVRFVKPDSTKPHA